MREREIYNECVRTTERGVGGGEIHTGKNERQKAERERETERENVRERKKER